MQLWKQGELHYEDISQILHQTHQQTPGLYNLFGQKHDYLVLLAQLDQVWFENWLVHNPAPPDTLLYSPPLEETNESELKGDAYI